MLISHVLSFTFARNFSATSVPNVSHLKSRAMILILIYSVCKLRKIGNGLLAIVSYMDMFRHDEQAGDQIPALKLYEMKYKLRCKLVIFQ